MSEENQQCCWNALEANSCKWIWTKKTWITDKICLFPGSHWHAKKKNHRNNHKQNDTTKLVQLYNTFAPLIITILIHPPFLYLLVTERWAKSKAINKVWHLKSLRVEHVYLGRSGNKKEQRKTIKQLPVNRCKCKSCDLFVWNVYVFATIVRAITLFEIWNGVKAHVFFGNIEKYHLKCWHFSSSLS